MRIQVCEVPCGMVVVGKDGRPWQVLERDLSLGHWNTRIHLRLQSLESQQVRKIAWRLDETVEVIPLVERSLVFLYHQDTAYVFFDPASGQLHELPAHLGRGWQRNPEPNEPVTGGFYRGQLRVVELP